MRNEDSVRPYMWTFTGRKFYLDKININDIDLNDIAIGLSRICRFSCQTKRWYSVATHSVLVAEQCPSELKMAGLFHDSAEYLLGDCNKVLKYMPDMYKAYKPLENKLTKAIARKFQFKFNKSVQKLIKKIEYPVFLAEVRDLMNLPADENIDLSQAANINFDQEYSPEQSRHIFLEYYNRLI